MSNLMSRTITCSKCPYCGKILSVTSRAGLLPESKIGKSNSLVCSQCKHTISDDKKEWPELSSEQKIFELFRYLFISCTTGIIFGGVLSFFLFLVFYLKWLIAM